MNIEGPVVVSRKGQARIERGHPWVFRSDIEKVGGASPGAVVRVADVRGTPLGFAFWSSHSEIRLRMIERGETLSEGFLRERIERALRWRETVAAGAEAYRVVHGEGDGVPSSWWTATATTSASRHSRRAPIARRPRSWLRSRNC